MGDLLRMEFLASFALFYFFEGVLRRSPYSIHTSLIHCPKNPDPQTHRVLRAWTPAMEGPTPATESPRILRVEPILSPF